MTNVTLVPAWVEHEPSSRALALEAMFRFLGTNVRVRSTNVGLLEHWATVYGAFRIPPGPAAVTVRVLGDDGPPVPGQVLIESGDDRRVWSGVGPVLPPLGVPPLDRWVYLRGAAVARAGRAVLLIGPPQSGKTLLAMAVVARGASLLSDGLLALDPRDLLLAPFPKTMRLRREVLAELSMEPAHPALIPFRNREGTVEWRADPRLLLGPRAARVAADVGAMVFLDGPAGARPARLTSVGAGDALARTLDAVYLPPPSSPATETLTRLASRVPTFALGPESRPLAAAQLIDEQLLV